MAVVAEAPGTAGALVEGERREREEVVVGWDGLGRGPEVAARVAGEGWVGNEGERNGKAMAEDPATMAWMPWY